jgi:hypothetical protein
MAPEDDCLGPMQASHRRAGASLERERSPMRSVLAVGPGRRRRLVTKPSRRLPFTVALVAVHALLALLPGAASLGCYVTPYEPCEVSRGYTGNCLEVINPVQLLGWPTRSQRSLIRPMGHRRRPIPIMVRTWSWAT